MRKFSFNTCSSIRFGSGMLSEVGQIAKSTLGSRILLVTDPGIVAVGIVDRAVAMLEDSGVEVVVYADVQADPSESVVLAAADLARTDRQGVIGLGGGSSLDVAKLSALLAVGAQTLPEIYGVGKAVGPRLPLMLVPTTAGTGSEVTPISIVTTSTSEKMGVVSPLLLPDIAILDPALTLGLPPHITAATGIDAMVHAIEAYASTSSNNNPISRHLAKEALRLMGGALERAVHHGHDSAARAEMLLGSMLAGQAFANSPVAAVHALAYPIGGHYHVPHGLSNALVLPHVLRFNCCTSPQPYAEIAAIVFPKLATMNSTETAAAFADELATLSERCGLPQRLRDMGIDQSDLPMLARDAMSQTRLLVNNPRTVTEADALEIYTSAW